MDLMIATQVTIEIVCKYISWKLIEYFKKWIFRTKLTTSIYKILNATTFTIRIKRASFKFHTLQM